MVLLDDVVVHFAAQDALANLRLYVGKHKNGGEGGLTDAELREIAFADGADGHIVEGVDQQVVAHDFGKFGVGFLAFPAKELSSAQVFRWRKSDVEFIEPFIARWTKLHAIA